MVLPGGGRMIFDLRRMQLVMAEVGNPQASFAAVHVAGTNGKGSVCALLAAALQASGFRTGLYTSPHLERINERFQINGQQISNDGFSRLSTRLNAVLRRPTI